MKITVIGTGYVGLVSGACLAELGNFVTCVDNNLQKITMLNNGEIPIYEPGLEIIVAQAKLAGNLEFSSDLKQALLGSDAVILAVGTPTDEKTGRADLSYIMAATKQIAEFIEKNIVVVVKSTVPVGTGERVKQILKIQRPDLNCDVVSNPEFLREGSAVNDFLKPDRILIGTDSDNAKDVMAKIYSQLVDNGYPLLFTNIPSAELIKYAANAFLATKTAFINEVADICEGVGADIEVVTKGMGMDERIGSKHMKVGPGYGGSCFPKDTLALVHIASDAGAHASIVETVVASNDARKHKMVEKIITGFDGDVKGKNIAILGLTFKANTDDMRYSPALVIVPELVKMGANLNLYDPAGMNEAKKIINEKVNWAPSLEMAVKLVDGLVIITEWDEFTRMDLNMLKNNMRGRLIIDLRNVLNIKKVTECGFKYISIGR